MARSILDEAEEDLKEMDLQPHMHMHADGGPQQRKSKHTSNPGQGGTIHDVQSCLLAIYRRSAS